PELVDHLPVEGLDVGGNLGRWSPWRRLLLTHALYRMFIWISSYHSCRNPRWHARNSADPIRLDIARARCHRRLESNWASRADCPALRWVPSRRERGNG